MQGVLSLIFQAHSREVPTPASEGFNTDAFAQMWAREREERRIRRLQAREVGNIEHDGQPPVVEVVDDVQMVVESDGSNWGSQAGDEESDEEL